MLDHSRLQNASHLSALRTLARSMAVSETVAVDLYERELHHLRDGARVDRFVSILAEKRAKDALRKMTHRREAPRRADG
jgi:hypothetical protein